MLFHSKTLVAVVGTTAAILPSAFPGVAACPFASGGGRADGHADKPCPRRLRMKQEASKNIIERSLLRGGGKQQQRSLTDGQPGGCFNQTLYDQIATDIEQIANDMANITDSREKGHFFGGIVRLAAHDFMDYDRSNSNLPLGQDGCIDFDVTGSGADNNGLQEIWCDSEDCPLTVLYNQDYASFGVGRADFWVAAANAVIKITSTSWTGSDDIIHTELNLPFRYGRVDRDDCSPAAGAEIDSAVRLPGAQGCDQVERKFVTEMGLTWTDATALLGAHTLGFGHTNFSGHDGMWMNLPEETIQFDKKYYEEILQRAWRQRNANSLTLQDWTWAGNNDGNPRFMLNADLCLYFDIDAAESRDCCARIRNGPNGIPGEVFCVDPGTQPDNATEMIGTITECNDTRFIREDAFNAVRTFARAQNDIDSRGINGDENGPFYEAFIEAWKKATEAGYEEGTLHSIANTCDDTPEPSLFPTSAPTSNPTPSPTVSPSSGPSVDCFRQDSVASFVHNDENRTCDWAQLTPGSNRCRNYAHICPVTCGECDCLQENWGCSTDEDCCSGICDPDNTCGCKANQSTCSSPTECCSGECIDGRFCGCLPTGETGCISSDDCCGNDICLGNGTCGCIPRGESGCTSDSDCCRGRDVCLVDGTCGRA